MTIAFDAITSTGYTTGNKSFTHTPVETKPCAILVLVTYGAASDTVSAATYGGVAMSQAIKVNNNSTEDASAYIYTLFTGIPSGAQTVAVTVPVIDSVAYCISLKGGWKGLQQDVDSAVAGPNPSRVLSANSKDVFACLVGTSDRGVVGSTTELVGWTSREEIDIGGQNTFMYTYDTIGTSDVTCGVTDAGSDVVFTAITVAAEEGGLVTIWSNE